jgi:ribonuclease BN (tRNA processing enzyme)
VLGERAHLVAHPEVVAELWPHHLAGGMRQLIDATHHRPHAHAHELADFFEVTELCTQSAVQVGPFAIEARRTVHHIPTFAMRIRAGGRSLGWSSDTAYDEGLIAWLAAADRLVHETNLGAHTPYDKLAALPPEVRQRMWLTHYPDDFDLEGSVVEPLRQGRVYEV